MECKRCKKEVTLDGVECPLCGKNNQDIVTINKALDLPIKKEVVEKVVEKKPIKVIPIKKKGKR